MRTYCFFKDTSVNEPQDLLDLKTGAALRRKVNLMMADHPYSTFSAQDQASSAYNVMCGEDMEDAVRFTSSVMASRAYGHSFCFDLVFHHSNKRLRRQNEMVGDVEAESKWSKERLSQVVQTEEQALMYVKTPRVQARSPP